MATRLLKSGWCVKNRGEKIAAAQIRVVPWATPIQSTQGAAARKAAAINGSRVAGRAIRPAPYCPSIPNSSTPAAR